MREKCESGFELEMYDELVKRGYRVQPQVLRGDYHPNDPSQKSRQTLPLKRMLISQEKLTCPNALVQNLNNKLLAMP